jgi:hypothetical protein
LLQLAATPHAFQKQTKRTHQLIYQIKVFHTNTNITWNYIQIFIQKNNIGYFVLSIKLN